MPVCNFDTTDIIVDVTGLNYFYIREGKKKYWLVKSHAGEVASLSSYKMYVINVRSQSQFVNNHKKVLNKDLIKSTSPYPI